MSNQHTAKVEVLTAEVRALMVGSRQVTLSVYRQLDDVSWSEIEPFGRVRDTKEDGDSFTFVHVIGKGPDGSLVRAVAHVTAFSVDAHRHYVDTSGRKLKSRWTDVELDAIKTDIMDAVGAVVFRKHVFVGSFSGGYEFAEIGDIAPAAVRWAESQPITTIDEWRKLPLIVLAGLR